jgi:class 3 adenylate cyclase/tetratricopeptide (TPR) repeat protein
LFADLVGFTQLSEQQDPEEVRDLLSRYFDVAREVIEGYGGAVEKFIGDAVMAVWGAPVAREDDPERAVRAGLELVSRVKGIQIGVQPLQMRVGVLSGEAAVVPGRVGEGMIAGDLVNTASRLQSVAPPGVVLVGEETHKATSAAIAYEAAGDHVLKGKQAPVPAWRALRVVARVGGAGREEGLEPPFVGREEELRLLKEQLHTAEREGKLRVVAISGQAGLGKSRLIWELEKYLDGLAAPVYYWHQGRSPSYGEGVTFWALGEMVRRRAHIAEGEDDASTRQKLRDTLAEFVPDSAERAWLEPALGALLGIDEANWNAREQLFSAWRTFFERVADHGPTVLAFEDLQWADNGLLDFIEHLLEWTRDKPILVVTLARPELLERRPNFAMGHRALVALHLDPLSDEAMASMLRGLVPALSDKDLARVVARAEGVPLYAVETIRSLVDGCCLARDGDVYRLVGELPPLDVPATLRALISSRLDALDAADRSLLQDASVLGLVFSVSALAALAKSSGDDIEPRLRALAHKELLAFETDPRSPERGQYRFRQGLIQEIAHATLSRRERRSRHLAAARYFETLGDDELAGVLASHYLEAFKAAPEGEEGATIAAQARVALRAAAERALRLHSYQQALSYLDQAIAVTFDEADLNDLRTRAARSAWAAGHLVEAEQYLRVAIAWSQAHGEVERAAEMTAILGGWLLERSRVDEGMTLLERTMAELPTEAQRGAVYLNGQLARGHLFRGEGEPGLVAASRALDGAERLGLRDPMLDLLITKSWALSQSGRYHEGVALLMGAMQMADDQDVLFARTRSRFNLSSYLIIEDPYQALRIAKEGMAIGQQYGLVAASMAGNAANAAFVIGDFDEVLRLEASFGEGLTSLAGFIHGSGAMVLAMRGDMAGAAERLAAVEQLVSSSTSAQDASEIRYQQAWIAFGAGDLDAALRLALDANPAGGSVELAAILGAHVALLQGDLDVSRATAESSGTLSVNASWLDRSRRTLEAGALAIEEKHAEAGQLYRRVIDEWRRADLRLDLALTLFERSRLLGDVDPEAAKGRDEAAQLFAQMGADGLLERIERGTAATRAPQSPVKPEPAAPRAGAAATTR